MRYPACRCFETGCGSHGDIAVDTVAAEAFVLVTTSAEMLSLCGEARSFLLGAILAGLAVPLAVERVRAVDPDVSPRTPGVDDTMRAAMLAVVDEVLAHARDRIDRGLAIAQAQRAVSEGRRPQ